MTRRLINLAGKRFGRLVVIERGDDYKTARGSRWICRCDCGTTKLIYGGHLRRGNTISCGCYIHDTPSPNRTHNRKKTSEYAIWCGIKDRCLNPNSRPFRDYGGRGIKVCERWAHSFENFLADMGERPSRSHSIDRIDNDGNYEPDNCRWATRKTQCNNTRKNMIVTYRGVSMRFAEALELSGSLVSRHTAYMRITARGWPVDRALDTPVHRRAA